MDIERIKFLISYEETEEGKIQTGDYINKELVELLRTNLRNMPNCFAKTPPTATCSEYDVECICSDCGTLNVAPLSKTRTLNYIKTGEFCCAFCREARKEKEKQLRAEQAVHNSALTQERTDLFIRSYLDPNRSWRQNATYADKRNAILQPFVDYDTVASYIKSMDYRDFLQTPYWDFVASMKKYRADYKCELCGATKCLHVHHKSYENHGREHTSKGLKDLIVLCKDCHSKFHDKE